MEGTIKDRLFRLNLNYGSVYNRMRLNNETLDEAIKHFQNKKEVPFSIGVQELGVPKNEVKTIRDYRRQYDANKELTLHELVQSYNQWKLSKVTKEDNTKYILDLLDSEGLNTEHNKFLFISFYKRKLKINKDISVDDAFKLWIGCRHGHVKSLRPNQQLFKRYNYPYSSSASQSVSNFANKYNLSDIDVAFQKWFTSKERCGHIINQYKVKHNISVSDALRDFLLHRIYTDFVSVSKDINDVDIDSLILDYNHSKETYKDIIDRLGLDLIVTSVRTFKSAHKDLLDGLTKEEVVKYYASHLELTQESKRLKEQEILEKRNRRDYKRS